MQCERRYVSQRMEATVTAIIPTYNRRELVLQSARSVSPDPQRGRVPGGRQWLL